MQGTLHFDVDIFFWLRATAAEENHVGGEKKCPMEASANKLKRLMAPICKLQFLRGKERSYKADMARDTKEKCFGTHFDILSHLLVQKAWSMLAKNGDTKNRTRDLFQSRQLEAAKEALYH